MFWRRIPASQEDRYTKTCWLLFTEVYSVRTCYASPRSARHVLHTLLLYLKLQRLIECLADGHAPITSAEMLDIIVIVAPQVGTVWQYSTQRCVLVCLLAVVGASPIGHILFSTSIYSLLIIDTIVSDAMCIACVS